MRNWFGKDLNDLSKVNLYSFQHLYKKRNWFGKNLNDLRRVFKKSALYKMINWFGKDLNNLRKICFIF